jgi:hypothetical protein
MSDAILGYSIRPVTAEEKAADNECYQCQAEVSYFVEPHGIVICANCAQSDLALNLGAHATPVGDSIAPPELVQTLTPEQWRQVMNIRIPPAGVRFRSFISMKLEPVDGPTRRGRITVEYDIPDGEPR